MKTKLKKEKYGIDRISERFPTEESCIQFLEELRWGNQPECPSCGNNKMNYYLSSTKRHKCRNCSYQFNVLTNSIFQSTKLNLRVWFKAIYYFTTNRRGISSCQLARTLGVEQRTAWFLLMRLREAVELDEDILLKGIVDVDETYFRPDPGKDTRVQRAKQSHEKKQDETYGYSPKRKTTIRKQLKQEENAEQKLAEFNEWQKTLAKNGERTPFKPAIAVLGMYQRDGKLILIHLGRQYFDTTKENINQFLYKHIDLDSVLITDESSFYTEIGRNFTEHLIVNHEKTYVTKSGVHTNGIENVFSHFKRTLRGTYFNMSNGHFFRYLNEHAYRWNTLRNSIKEQFDTLFNSVFGKKMTYRELKLTQKTAA